MKRLSRRSCLKGLGVALALPPLQAMAGRQPAPPMRLAFIGVPNGVNLDRWRPRGVGSSFELGPTFSPAAAFKTQLQVFTGFSQDNANAHGDGPGDHARAGAAFLTGAHPRKTAGADLRNGVSVDQVAAQAVGHLTRLPSLELIAMRTRQSGNCDSGYSCAYQYNMSWASDTLPVAAEPDPRLVFERLFGDGPPRERQRRYLERQRRRKSMLDFVRNESARMAGQLGGEDRRKLDEYLSGLRDVERQIERAEQHKLPRAPMSAPDAIPEDFRTHIRLMSDLLTLAFQSDSTRVATLLFANEGNNRSFNELDISEGHHHLSHHQKNADNLEKVGRIDAFYMAELAHFLGKLASARDLDGASLLEHTLVLYGGAIGDGDRHNHDDLPILLAGGGRQRCRPGRHVQLPGAVPLNNLFLGILGRFGVKCDRLGDSTAVYDDF